ncbi:HdeD family acid-resistance protein [Butyrivibrio proteoclasticus]|uniref:HdeD family acid-resistance protein n=1 Tax=Butyrivibrio proteoclasticus TaxID=43305 RepID=UPI00047ADD3D|nr:DUF308 domain-containing protein [Butyrivibrio proteoclasticus]
MNLKFKLKVDYVAQSIIMIVIGLVLMFWTKASIDFVARALAVLLMVIGAIFIISYLSHKERNFELSGSFVVGLIIFAIGGWIYLNPGKFTDFIPKLFGLFILISGIRNVGQAFSLMKYKAKTSWVSLIIAFVTMGLGVFLLTNPTGAKEIAVTLIGLFLVVDGGTNLISSLLVEKAEKRVKQEQEAIDVDAVIVEEEDKK